MGMNSRRRTVKLMLDFLAAMLAVPFQAPELIRSYTSAVAEVSSKEMQFFGKWRSRALRAKMESLEHAVRRVILSDRLTSSVANTAIQHYITLFDTLAMNGEKSPGFLKIRTAAVSVAEWTGKAPVLAEGEAALLSAEGFEKWLVEFQSRVRLLRGSVLAYAVNDLAMRLQ